MSGVSLAAEELCDALPVTGGVPLISPRVGFCLVVLDVPQSLGAPVLRSGEGCLYWEQRRAVATRPHRLTFAPCWVSAAGSQRLCPGRGERGPGVSAGSPSGCLAPRGAEAAAWPGAVPAPADAFAVSRLRPACTR